MAIVSIDNWFAASRQKVSWLKTGTKTLVAAMPYTVFDVAGEPPAGTLNVGNTANGLVPTVATTGYPKITSFGGKIGYLNKVDFGSSVACCFDIYDRLFVAGAYAYNADTTLASQPSYSSRVPGGTDYTGLELWVEAVTAFTLVPAFQINYLDQDGAAGDTGSQAAPLALPLNRMARVPLAAGDNGLQQITRVRCITASAGTFNVMVLRFLWSGRVIVANGGDVHDLLKTGFPQVFEDSALYTVLYADAVAVGLPEIALDIKMG
jgi:hypothetical protein